MNFFKARLEETNGEVWVRGDSLAFALPGEIVARTKGHVGNAVILGIRPEDIHDGRGEATPGRRAGEARIDVVEHMGNENFVHMTSGGTSFMARMDSAIDARAGANLPIAVAAHKIHLFDPVTEKAIS
jgi:multiple sugar transport system ATP-binding protein